MTSRILLLIVALISPMLGGCAINNYKSSGAEPTVSVIPVQAASGLKANARLDGGALLVFGNVRKYHDFKNPGHVHIEVRKQDGTLVGESRQRLFAHASKRGGVKEVKFRTQMDIQVPENPMIQVWYHAPPFGEE